MLAISSIGMVRFSDAPEKRMNYSSEPIAKEFFVNLLGIDSLAEDPR